MEKREKKSNQKKNIWWRNIHTSELICRSEHVGWALIIISNTKNNEEKLKKSEQQQQQHMSNEKLQQQQATSPSIIYCIYVRGWVTLTYETMIGISFALNAVSLFRCAKKATTTTGVVSYLPLVSWCKLDAEKLGILRVPRRTHHQVIYVCLQGFSFYASFDLTFVLSIVCVYSRIDFLFRFYLFVFSFFSHFFEQKTYFCLVLAHSLLDAPCWCLFI